MGGILHIKDRMPATTPKICNKAFFFQAPPQLYVKPDAITPEQWTHTEKKRTSCDKLELTNWEQIHLVSFVIRNNLK